MNKDSFENARLLKSSDYSVSRRHNREMMIRRNYLRNKPIDAPSEMYDYIRRYARIISFLPFEDVIAQYNIEDDLFEITLYFKDDLDLSVLFRSRDCSDCVFVISYQKEVIVSDCANLEYVIERFDTVLKTIYE